MKCGRVVFRLFFYVGIKAMNDGWTTHSSNFVKTGQ